MLLIFFINANIINANTIIKDPAKDFTNSIQYKRFKGIILPLASIGGIVILLSNSENQISIKNLLIKELFVILPITLINIQKIYKKTTKYPKLKAFLVILDILYLSTYFFIKSDSDDRTLYWYLIIPFYSCCKLSMQAYKSYKKDNKFYILTSVWAFIAVWIIAIFLDFWILGVGMMFALNFLIYNTFPFFKYFFYKK